MVMGWLRFSWVLCRHRCRSMCPDLRHSGATGTVGARGVPSATSGFGRCHDGSGAPGMLPCCPAGARRRPPPWPRTRHRRVRDAAAGAPGAVRSRAWSLSAPSCTTTCWALTVMVALTVPIPSGSRPMVTSCVPSSDDRKGARTVTTCCAGVGVGGPDPPGAVTTVGAPGAIGGRPAPTPVAPPHRPGPARALCARRPLRRR